MLFSLLGFLSSPPARVSDHCGPRSRLVLLSLRPTCQQSAEGILFPIIGGIKEDIGNCWPRQHPAAPTVVQRALLQPHISALGVLAVRSPQSLPLQPRFPAIQQHCGPSCSELCFAGFLPFLFRPSLPCSVCRAGRGGSGRPNPFERRELEGRDAICACGGNSASPTAFRQRERGSACLLPSLPMAVTSGLSGCCWRATSAAPQLWRRS